MNWVVAFLSIAMFNLVVVNGLTLAGVSRFLFPTVAGFAVALLLADVIVGTIAFLLARK